jgi:uncharacterized membrane protein YbaN (DUF454 family)
MRSSWDMDEMQVINGRISARKGDRADSGHGTKREVRAPNRLVRGLLVVAGTVCVGLGVLGIFLPLLPTTPFLLLAAACYGSSSRRFYQWLLNNRWFGDYLRDYREKKGVPLKVKLFAISLLWLTILLAVAFVVDILPIRIVLILIAGLVTTHILRIRTLRADGDEE